jgi:hypothetical protein
MLAWILIFLERGLVLGCPEEGSSLVARLGVFVRLSGGEPGRAPTSR